ncbi:hypothetical protein Pyn_20145 [Prunus yedoensis var. nudiflora]|uniref:Uncharacterized protein n=1 Tax=Prunus yedoensis var. nudiflora TaxID=2094558 RepID=A0A314YW37_PRUYE|nr:hypothetical protein Pyn_20145 [Prunus yedoensis var. nudiflora]
MRAGAQQVPTESARQMPREAMRSMRNECRQKLAEGNYTGAQRAGRMRNARRQIMGNSWQVTGNVLEWVYNMAKRVLSSSWVVGCG